jgi:hypothetical protein
VNVSLESVEDELKPKLELTLLRGLGHVHAHCGVLDEERKRAGVELAHQSIDEVRRGDGGDLVTKLPDGESQDVAIESVVAPRRRFRREPCASEPREDRLDIGHACGDQAC